MGTREKLLVEADRLLRTKGPNGFSYADLAQVLQIRKASIHYYFAGKTELFIALLEETESRLKERIIHNKIGSRREALESFMALYRGYGSEDELCIVGALCGSLPTLDSRVQQSLEKLTDSITDYVTQVLEEGKAQGEFNFKGSSRMRAFLIINSLLASVQVKRVQPEAFGRELEAALMADILI